MRNTNSPCNQGFTLVELIIVIIILGILAALAIPQFSTTTRDSQEAALKGNLAIMRNAIQRYYHEHRATYPGLLSTDGSGTVNGSDAEVMFALGQQMFYYSNENGATSATKDAAYPLGPYFLKEPVNPVAGNGIVKVVLNLQPISGADVGGNRGWIYNPQTGEVRANHVDYLTY